MKGTAELTYTIRRQAKRRPWMRGLFWLRHRWHSKIARILGGAYMASVTVCPRCGVFMADDGVQAGSITFMPEQS